MGAYMNQLTEEIDRELSSEKKNKQTDGSGHKGAAVLVPDFAIIW